MNTAKHQTSHKCDILEITKHHHQQQQQSPIHSRRARQDWNMLKKKNLKEEEEASVIACTRPHTPMIPTTIHTHHHPHPHFQHNHLLNPSKTTKSYYILYCSYLIYIEHFVPLKPDNHSCCLKQKFLDPSYSHTCWRHYVTEDSFAW